MPFLAIVVHSHPHRIFQEASMISQKIIKCSENIQTGTRTYYPGDKSITPDYIYEMVDTGMYAITYPIACDLFGQRNFIQIHRDLPGSVPSSYRILLTKKLSDYKTFDPDFLQEQLEFYVPIPDKLQKAMENMLKYALGLDSSRISITEPKTAGAKFRKISLPQKPVNELNEALLQKVGAHEFYIIIK